jgi:predicted Zn-dependent protease
LILFIFLFAPPYFTNPLDPSGDLDKLNKSVTEHRLDLDYWKNRLKIYIDLEALSQAEPVIDRLCLIHPEEPLFQDLKMMVLSENGEYPDAIALGKSILTHFPDYTPVTLNLSIVYFKSGKSIQALNLLFSKHTKTLRPSDWKNVMTLLNQAFPEPSRLLEMLTSKSAEFPENRRLSMLILACLIRSGAYDAARRWIGSHAYLLDNPDIRKFNEGMLYFETK